MHILVRTISEKRDNEFKGEWREVYGKVWMEKKEGGNVMKLQSHKKTIVHLKKMSENKRKLY